MMFVKSLAHGKNLIYANYCCHLPSFSLPQRKISLQRQCSKRKTNTMKGYLCSHLASPSLELSLLFSKGQLRVSIHTLLWRKDGCPSRFFLVSSQQVALQDSSQQLSLVPSKAVDLGLCQDVSFGLQLSCHRIPISNLGVCSQTQLQTPRTQRDPLGTQALAGTIQSLLCALCFTIPGPLQTA